MVGLQAGLLLGCLDRNSQGISVEDWQHITLIQRHSHITWRKAASVECQSGQFQWSGRTYTGGSVDNYNPLQTVKT